MEPLKVTDTTFDRDVLGAARPVLVDFWATWCAPCRAVAPIIDELAAELKDTVLVAKVDVDESPIIATRYRIQSIPTFVLFDKGKPVSALQGGQTKPRFLKFLEAHVPALRPPSIGVKELDATLKSGLPVALFDLRDARDYARSHLRRAKCVAPDTLDEALAELKPGTLAVLICRTGERSAAEAASRTGRDVRVVALEKGLLEWEGSNKPTYSSKEEAELGA